MRIKLSSRMHISNQNGLFYLILAYQDVEITVDLMEVAESKESDFVDGVWQATSITRLPMLLLDTRLPFGSLIPGCEELLDPAGTGSFYNEGEADIVVEHITALLAAGAVPYSILLKPCCLLLIYDSCTFIRL